MEIYYIPLSKTAKQSRQGKGKKAPEKNLKKYRQTICDFCRKIFLANKPPLETPDLTAESKQKNPIVQINRGEVNKSME